MLNIPNFISIFINNSKSCLSFMKLLRRRKVKTPQRENNCTKKICTSAKPCSTFNGLGNSGPKIDLNWCFGQLSNGRKIIFVLYANDCQPCLLQQLAIKAVTVATEGTSPYHQSLGPIFQLKLINVQTEEDQLSVVSQVQQRQSSELPSQLSALVCILISSKMAFLMNTINASPMRPWLTSCHSTQNSTAADSDSDEDSGLATFACYDESNEINFFQVKYKLAAGTTSIVTDSANLYDDIVQAGRRLCNEALYRKHQYPNSVVKQGKRAMFKVFPKQIYETNGKVLVSFSEPITGDQQLDVLLNGRYTPPDHLLFKWRNDSTLCLTVPDNILNDCTQVDISLIINCTTFLGTRTIKCSRMAETAGGNFISSENLVHDLCQSLGAHSMTELDAILAQVFIESLPKLPLYSFIVDSTDTTNQLLPTWLHFAARFGLKEVVMKLVSYPAFARFSSLGNINDSKPIDLAIEHGHWEVVRILNTYRRQTHISQKQLIALPNSENAIPKNSSCLHLLSTPTLSSGQKLQVNGTEVALRKVSEENGNADKLDTALVTCSPTSSLDHSTDRIIEAKNELLLLIEKFKCGISIESFEELFSNWERIYSDVLEGQMSEELQYSLNQIKMLCALDYDEDVDEEKEKIEEEVVEKNEHYYRDHGNHVTRDGDYAEAEKENGAQLQVTLNEAKKTQPTLVFQQIGKDPNGKQLKPCTEELLNGTIEQYTTAFHHKDCSVTTVDGKTTRQVVLNDWDSRWNVFAMNANRQFSRDLNSINMSDNEVPLEKNQEQEQKKPLVKKCNCQEGSERHQQVTTVSNCQAKCHQFEGHFGSPATNKYMPSSAHWGQLMLPTKESILPPESEKHTNPSRLQPQCFTGDNNAEDNSCPAEDINEAQMTRMGQENSRRTSLPQASSKSGSRSDSVYQSPPTSFIAVRQQLTNLPVSHCSGSERKENKLNQLPPAQAELDRTPSADDRLCRLKQLDSHGKHDYYHFCHGQQTATNFNETARKETSADCSLTGKGSIDALMKQKTNQSFPPVELVDRLKAAPLSTGLVSSPKECRSGSHYYLIPRSIPVPASSFYRTHAESGNKL